MGERYKPYPAYKDSGVEWLGDIPESWRTAQVKHFYDVSLGKMLQPNKRAVLDELKPYLRAASITWHGVDVSSVKEMWFSLEERRTLRLKKGDLLISEGGDVGRACFWNEELEECYFQNSINRVRARGKSHPSYLSYWLRTLKDAGFIDIICNKSTIAHYTAEKVQTTPILAPGIEEQEKIATFLEHETAKIDALISKQRRLIELLQEKRQAVISRAVTKGLNPDAPMKDSEEQWLGRIPQHWIVAKLNYRYSIELGKMLDEKRITGEHTVPYLRNQDVQWGSMNLSELPGMDIAPDEYERYTIQEGDLLACEGGDVGRAAIVRNIKERYGFQKALHRLRPRDTAKDTAEFFYFVLVAAKEQGVFEENDTKATISHLPAEKFRKYRFAFPPLEEQQKIAGFLRFQSTKLSNIITRARQGIAFLQERRTALISAAVTGKIDVRDWRPPAQSVLEREGVAL